MYCLPLELKKKQLHELYGNITQFSNPYIYAIWCDIAIPDYVRPKSLRLKYERFKPSGSKDMRNWKLDFVTISLYAIFVMSFVLKHLPQTLNSASLYLYSLML